MVANTDNLCPNDRASVLKIIDGWNNPTVIDLEQAKHERAIEADPIRQRGCPERRLRHNYDAPGYAPGYVPELHPYQRAVFEETNRVSLVQRPKPDVPPLDLRELIESCYNLIRRRRESVDSGSWLEPESDPFAGTFVRGGWRRRRVYPNPKLDTEYTCVIQSLPPLFCE